MKRKLRDAWATAKWGVALAVPCGLVALLIPNTPLARWSYDLPHWITPKVEIITNVAVVYMDEAAHAFLKQPYEDLWDRSIQARLVEVLTKSGAAAIAFDVLFDGPGNPVATRAFAESIRTNGHVVLAAGLGTGDYYGLASDLKLILPHTNLLAATPYWGFNQLEIDGDDEVRQHYHGWENVPSLSWELARLLGAPTTKEPNSQRQKRWINYYGERGTIPGMSLHQVLNGPEIAAWKFFHNRVVFVGSATESGPSGKRRDRFHAPYWKEFLWPGVDFHATEFLNLMRGDWLRRMHPIAEFGLVVLCGIGAGFSLGMLGPRAATFTALGAAALLAVTACLLVWQTHIWFAWLVVVAVQIPIALTCSIVRRVQSEIVLNRADRTTDFPSAGSPRRVVIPDHEILRRIGSGSYGEVWLARSATGTLRAVKIVDRKSAKDPRFEREFSGLQRFEPISRAHQGLVDILHIGRNEAAGVLYYVMELADSCAMVTGADAEGYVPTTLKTKLLAENHFQPRQVAYVTLALTSALAFLHEEGLMHRDIKPSNIIFVNGQPKLADIGLVAAADETLSFVGTEGFIPPEGPGTPAADVYSLGKVLSEVLAKTAPGHLEGAKLDSLALVIEHACARNRAERYPTAKEMLADLSRAAAQY